MLRLRCQRKGGRAVSFTAQCGAGEVFTSSQSHKGSIIVHVIVDKEIKEPNTQEVLSKVTKAAEVGPTCGVSRTAPAPATEPHTALPHSSQHQCQSSLAKKKAGTQNRENTITF